MGNCFSSSKPSDPGHTVGSPTTKRTEKSPPKHQQRSQPKASKGHVLGTNSITQPVNEKPLGSETVDAKEAARRAAQERFEAQNTKQGALGQKLQQERNKSGRSHLKDAAEKKLRDSETNKPLVYD